MRLVRFTAASTAVLCASMLLAGCNWFGGHKSSTRSVSVFDVKAGQCFVGPKDVKSELSKLTETPCGKEHTQESYAIAGFTAADGSTPSAFPGEDVLTKFAQGACAQRFRAYVGVDYLDSKLYFTYLLPSARGWEQDDDRNVLCFVTTTGATLTSSVKNSKK